MRTKLFTVTIKDCVVQTFCTGGPGGQHKNAKANGVRVIHEPSGAIGQAVELREQYKNKRTAFVRMAKSLEFQLWSKKLADKLMGSSPASHKSTREHSGYGSRYVRTYDYPDRTVKDHDTGHVRHDLENVMSGDIDSFIDARMRKAAA